MLVCLFVCAYACALMPLPGVQTRSVAPVFVLEPRRLLLPVRLQGGLRLLAAGSDRAFRVFSTIQDQQSRELSQKHVGRKAKRLKVCVCVPFCLLDCSGPLIYVDHRCVGY